MTEKTIGDARRELLKAAFGFFGGRSVFNNFAMNMRHIEGQEPVFPIFQGTAPYDSAQFEGDVNLALAHIHPENCSGPFKVGGEEPKELKTIRSAAGVVKRNMEREP